MKVNPTPPPTHTHTLTHTHTHPLPPCLERTDQFTEVVSLTHKGRQTLTLNLTQGRLKIRLKYILPLFFWHVTWALPTSVNFTPQSCDMWSLGVVIYIMLCGYPPFYSEVPRKQLSQGMKRRIMAGEYDYPEKEWSKISPEAKEVIARYVTLTIWIEPQW